MQQEVQKTYDTTMHKKDNNANEIKPKEKDNNANSN